MRRTRRLKVISNFEWRMSSCEFEEEANSAPQERRPTRSKDEVEKGKFNAEGAEFAEGAEGDGLTTENGYVVCQGVLGKSCFENFEKEKGCRLGRSLSFPFC